MTSQALVSTAHVQCRTIGHTWGLSRKALVRDSQRGLAIITLSCHTCGAIRDDEVVRSTGRLAKRTYTYPTDYLLDEASRRTRAEWRTLLLRNLR